MRAVIAGTGHYVPEKTITNDMLSGMVDTSDEWIRTRTGISQRRVTDLPTWELALRAAQNAMDDAGLAPSGLDMIVGCTASHDYYFPSLACVVQGKLGAAGAFCFDASAGCTGFVYGLDIARAYIESGRVKAALVVCAEELTRLTDFTDRSTCVLFGDGAGAAVLRAGADKGRGVLAGVLGADGTQGPALYARSLPIETPFARIADGFIPECPPGKVHMDGQAVYKYAVKSMEQSVRAVCAAAGITTESIDLMIPHQANSRIINSAAQRLRIPSDKVYINLDRFANTSAASIPIALSECVRDGRLSRGDTLCITAVGAGLTYGAAIIKY